MRILTKNKTSVMDLAQESDKILANVYPSNEDDQNLSHFYSMCKRKYSVTDECRLEMRKIWIIQNELIVNNSVSVSSPSFQGYSPLHFAVEFINLSAIQALIQYGADCTAQNARGQTPLQLGADMIMLRRKKLNPSKETKILHILDRLLILNDGNLLSNPVNNHGLSHFHIACYRDLHQIVRKFLEFGVQVDHFLKSDSPYWSGYTSLHIASKYSCLKTVNVLLEYKASIYAKNSIGLSPLHIALKRGDGPLIEMMLSKVEAQQINSTYVDGMSLLHIGSVMSVDLQQLQELMQSGMDVNGRISPSSPVWPGCTPLHVAMQKKCLAMIRFLVKNGADLRIPDVNGLSPFLLAIHKQLLDNTLIGFIMTELLIRSCRNTDVGVLNFFCACASADLNLIQVLLRKGVNVNSHIPTDYSLCFPDGYTPLHLSVECGKEDIVELFLKNGADFIAQDTNGRSPLHLAKLRKNSKIVQKILSFHGEHQKNPTDIHGISHFHIICSSHRTDLVREFLNGGVFVNLVTEANDTPLHFSVRSKKLENTAALLEFGADFTVQNLDGLSSLHEAFLTDNKEIVKAILSYHTQKLENPVDNTELSHFHIACAKNEVKLVRAFINSGCNINAHVIPNSHNYALFTPLHFSVKFGCHESVSLLLHHGAKIDAKDNENKIPLMYAFKFCSKIRNHITNLFWEALRIRKLTLVDGDFNLSSLHIACICDDHQAVNELVKQGMCINSTTTKKCPLWPKFSPLHFAVKYGSLDTIKVLLSNGAQVNVQDGHGFTPLHLACSSANSDIVELLLTHDCDHNLKSDKHLTPLRLALQTKNNKIVQLILSQKTAIIANPMDNKGLTYFHIACLKNLISVVKNFLSTAVDIDQPVHFLAPKSSGYTALHIAVERRNDDLINLLLAHKANTNAVNSSGCTPLHLACISKAAQTSISSKLLEHGADPNKRNIFGETLVEFLIVNNQPKILQVALEHGADFDSPDPITERRPLELAIKLRHECIVDILLKAGADATARSVYGETFVHRILSLNLQADEAYLYRTFVKLLERGCSLDAKNASGRAALHQAYWPINLPALKALLSCGADVDVEDRSGRTVISYFLEITSSHLPRVELFHLFLTHLRTRTHCFSGLFSLSPLNLMLLQELLNSRSDYEGDEPTEDPDWKPEMQKMRETKFGTCTLYEMTKWRDKMAAHLARNGCLGEFLKSQSFKESFPLCGCLVMKQYASAVKRKDLLWAAESSFKRMMRMHFVEIEWIEECTESIIGHLSDEELRYFADAYP